MRPSSVIRTHYEAVHRGYLAATHNPRVGGEAKRSAEKVLHDLETAHSEGVVEGEAKATKASGLHKEKSPYDDDGGDDVHKHRRVCPPFSHRNRSLVSPRAVIGGLKATLHRDDRSDETKEHAKEKLRAMGATV
ncbi:hypothetical protein JCM1840_004331 [Sporobolomyces johnsonii]